MWETNPIESWLLACYSYAFILNIEFLSSGHQIVDNLMNFKNFL